MRFLKVVKTREVSQSEVFLLKETPTQAKRSQQSSRVLFSAGGEVQATFAIVPLA